MFPNVNIAKAIGAMFPNVNTTMGAQMNPP